MTDSNWKDATTPEMVVTLQRTQQTAQVTLGELLVNGAHEAWTVEPGNGGLHQDIPAGRYALTVNFSQRFGRMLPLVLNVPGRLGIRIHPGNSDSDTEGCLLLGTKKQGLTVLHSREAVESFQGQLAHALASSRTVWITVIDVPKEPVLNV